MKHIKQHIGFYFLALVSGLVFLFVQFSLSVPHAQKYGDFDYKAFTLANEGKFEQAAARFTASADIQPVNSMRSMSYFYSALMHYNMKNYSRSLDNIVLSLQENVINASPFSLLTWVISDISLQTEMHTYFNKLQQIEEMDQARLSLIVDSYIERLPEQQNANKFINLLNEPLKSSMKQRLTNNAGAAEK